MAAHKKFSKRRKKGRSGDKRLARFILIAAVIMNFILLIPLFDGLCLVSGDGTAHYAASQAIRFRFDADRGFFGNWNQLWAMGFPAYDYYQYAAHLLLVMLHYLTFTLVPILVLEKLVIIAAVTFFPFSLYYGMRRLGLSPLPSAFASFFSFALSSSVGHGGIGFSLVHHGLFTFLLGIFLFPIAIARVRISIDEGRSYFLAVLFFSSTLLIHPIVGYAAGIVCVIFIFRNGALSSKGIFLRRLARLALVFAAAFIVVSHFFVPFLLEQGFYGGTFFINSGDYYRSGAPQVMFDFLTGKSLDFFRFPFALLTLFFFIGLYAAIAWDSKNRFPLRFALTGFILFLLISFGRSFWGVLFDLIPGMGFMISFRFMFALQFFALFFVGAGFAFVFSALRRRLKRFSPSAVLLIFLAVLSLPVFAQVLMMNDRLCTMANSGFDEDSFAKLVLFLRHSPDGRFIARPELGFRQPYFESLLPIYTAHDSFGTSSMGAQDNLAYFFIQDFMLLRQHFYDYYNVRYALMPSDTDPGQEFFNQEFVSGNYTLYSITTSGFFSLVDSSTALVYDDSLNSGFVRDANRAWLGSHAMKGRDVMSMFHASEEFDASLFDRVVRESDSAHLSALEQVFDDPFLHDRKSCGEVLYENRSLNQYVASVLTDRSCYLLFKMSYDPGWKARINEVPAEVFAVSPSFMAVRVGPGISDVQFHYMPDLSLRYWLLVFGIVVLAGLLLFDIGGRGKKRAKVTSDG